MRWLLSKILSALFIVCRRFPCLTWVAAQIRYFNATGCLINWSRPKDINQKLFWLMRYWQHPLKTVCADKLAVRGYLGKCGLGHLLIPLIAVYDDALSIPFEELPNAFVLKCNHGSGYNIICTNKNDLDVKGAKELLSCWLKTDYSLVWQEIHYRPIVRKIVCEKLLSTTAPTEYQFWCLNGMPDSILVCRKNYGGGYEAQSYSLNWDQLFDRIGETDDARFERPLGLEQMIEYSKTLSKPFPFVRVDFYEVSGVIYFAEMTFTPCANVLFRYKQKFLARLSDRLILPQKIG